jgi:hypothetical protein
MAQDVITFLDARPLHGPHFIIFLVLFLFCFFIPMSIYIFGVFSFGTLRLQQAG